MTTNIVEFSTSVWYYVSKIIWKKVYNMGISDIFNVSKLKEENEQLKKMITPDMYMLFQTLVLLEKISLK